MDIYTILSSKPHTIHYLNRYVKFIENCKAKNIDFIEHTEKHHICPKAKDMFPEYKNVKKYSWNNVLLTPRQHFIAHTMLWKIYPKSRSQSFALYSMKNYGNKMNSKLFEKLRFEISLQASARMKNKVSVQDKEGNIFQMDKTSEEFKSGNFISTQKNKVMVKDINGNCYKLDKDDDRYISGEYIGIMNGVTGRKLSEETKHKISINNVGFKGKKHSETSKNTTSNTLKETWSKRPIKICPHCGKTGKKSMERFHFDNCKFIK